MTKETKILKLQWMVYEDISADFRKYKNSNTQLKRKDIFIESIYFSFDAEENWLLEATTAIINFINLSKSN